MGWSVIRSLKIWQTDSSPPTARPLGQYGNTVFQLLAISRFVAFAMGTGLVFGVGDLDQSTSVVVVVALAGVFNSIVVVWRLNLAAQKTHRTMGFRWR